MFLFVVRSSCQWLTSREHLYAIFTDACFDHHGVVLVATLCWSSSLSCSEGEVCSHAFGGCMQCRGVALAALCSGWTHCPGTERQSGKPEHRDGDAVLLEAALTKRHRQNLVAEQAHMALRRIAGIGGQWPWYLCASCLHVCFGRGLSLRHSKCLAVAKPRAAEVGTHSPCA